MGTTQQEIPVTKTPSRPVKDDSVFKVLAHLAEIEGNLLKQIAGVEQKEMWVSEQPEAEECVVAGSLLNDLAWQKEGYQARLEASRALALEIECFFGVRNIAE
jgi:hypothetical protein